MEWLWGGLIEFSGRDQSWVGVLEWNGVLVCSYREQFEGGGGEVRYRVKCSCGNGVMQWSGREQSWGGVLEWSALVRWGGRENVGMECWSGMHL